MKSFWLWLIPEQPIALADTAVIASRTLRGMIAAAALRTCVPGPAGGPAALIHEDGPCGPNCQYWPLFGPRSGLRVGHGYAAPSREQVEPFPQTAYTCRDFPGFLAEGGHGVADCAIREFVFDEARGTGTQPAGGIFAPLELRCPTCGAPLVRAEGCFSTIRAGAGSGNKGTGTSPLGGVVAPLSGSTGANDKRFRLIVPAPARHVAEHRAIAPLRGRPAAAFRQAGYTFPPGTGIGAYVTIPDTLEMPLRTVLFRDLYLGGRRTRGMGRVRAELIPLQDMTLTMRERIASFNRAVRAERRFYAAMQAEHGNPDEDGTWYFTLDYPEGIIADNVMLLDPLAGVRTLSGVRVVRQWSRASTQGGWSMAAGLPAHVLVVQHGVSLCMVPPELDRVQVEQALAYLEVYGLGAGRDQGLGNIMICAPFHLELSPA